MKKAQVNFIVDSVAFIGFIFLAASGIIMYYLLPPGTGHSASIWGMSRHDWGAVHFWISVGFLAAMAFHLFLHWRWIVNVWKGQKRAEGGSRAAVGLVSLLALLAIAIAPMVSPVEQTGTKQVQTETQEGEEATIRGSMTLQEVSDLTGVPADFILRELGLPDNIAPRKKLGQLKQEYGVEVNDVRRVVAEYQKEGGD
jgi:hypothetical protein